MTGAYRYTPDIWPPLAAAIFLAALSLYSWRHRRIPGAVPLAVGSLFGMMWLLGMATEAAAVAPSAKIAWHKFQAVLQLAGVTATTCFALEYSAPGRWLTRRNLALLSLPPLLALLAVTINAGQFMWHSLQVAPDGTIKLTYATTGAVIVAYGLGLVAINTVALLSLFIRSPQHRWPVVLILFGQTASRGLYVLGFTQLPWVTGFDPVILAIALNWSMIAVALFGFRILDPLAAARQSVIRQMREGMVVFDDRWRIVSANPAAETILGAPTARLRGRLWQEVLPVPENLSGPGLPNLLPGDTPPALADISLGGGASARCYAVDLSLLKDPRGQDIGRLLLLLDTTEQRRAQAQAMEQQRRLAVIRERGRLARELHDSVGQVLAFVNSQGQTARRSLARGDIASADAQLARLIEVAREADTDVRESILGLRVALAEEGLLPALASYSCQFEKRYGIHTELKAPPLADGAFEPLVEVQLLRIIQEALTNVRKHAGASYACVTLSIDDGCAHVTVTDDGCGFDPQEVRGEFGGRVGLRMMRERAAEVGGTVAVRSAVGEGTQISVTVPARGDGASLSVTEGGAHARSAG